MLQKSALLTYLLSRAEQIGGKKTISANEFFVATLSVICENAEDKLPAELKTEDVTAELKAISELISNHKIDVKKTLVGLAKEIKSASYSSGIDEILFGKIKFDAENKAQKAKRSEIDADIYVQSILSDPTLLLKKYIAEGSENGAPDDTAVIDEELSELEKFFLSVNQDVQKNKEDDAQDDSKLYKIVSQTQKIQKKLLDTIYGQDHAINTFVSGYFQSEMIAASQKNRKKPKATFLFAGPPGVGKTFLAESAAEAIGLPFARFDMSEYCDNESNIEFCGSDKVYKNPKPGNITSFVSNYPKCVLLFDEIEKAHITIIHLFLQILDVGRIRDNYTDEEVSFADAIIIFTTNAGRSLYSDPTNANLSGLSRKQIIKALSNDKDSITGKPAFPEAICSRFASGNVIMFNHLESDNLQTIVERELQKNVKALEKATNLKITLDSGISTAIMLSEGGKADARTVKGRAGAFLHEELYELFRLIDSGEIIESLEEIKIGLSLDGSEGAVSEMFAPSGEYEVLIFAERSLGAKCSKLLSGVKTHVTDNIDDARSILSTNTISVILCNVECGAKRSVGSLLNLEDIESDGRDFLTYVLARYSIPVYLLQNEYDISREEFLSFAKEGVKDVLPVKTNEKNGFNELVLEKCTVAHRQSNMVKLAAENKVVSYKTSQEISKDKKSATVSLFGFRLRLAKDGEDSKSIVDGVSKPSVKFSDVIGAQDAKDELEYFVEYLKNPSKFSKMGVRAPRGVLLYGPPGTGKTLLAKAIAGESDVTFIAAEGNQFLKKYIGEGSEAVHELFKTARKYAPSILFVDEIDAIAKDRNGSEATEGASNTLTAFLTEMDGFNTDAAHPVFVLAATNYNTDPENGKSLDSALIRRFDRKILVDLPSKEERARYLEMKAARYETIKLSAEQIESIAVRSTGMSLAQLESVFELALRNGIRTCNTKIGDKEFDEAFESFNSGEARQRNQESIRRTARHEAGHTLISWLSGDKPSYVTVVSRGNYGGYMHSGDNTDKCVYTKKELLDRIRTSLAGRAAEIVYYGEQDGISTGASGDLRNATELAKRMLCSYGMDSSLGLACIDANPSSACYSDIQIKINEILKDELNKAIELVSSNKKAIDKLVSELMDNNHLNEKEIDKILKSTVIRRE